MDEIKSDATDKRMADPVVRALPQQAGFYWWRQDHLSTWRMVHVWDLNYAIGEEQFLVCYDVEFHSFGGRSTIGWAEHFMIGEWVRCERPNPVADLREGPEVRP